MAEATLILVTVLDDLITLPNEDIIVLPREADEANTVSSISTYSVMSIQQSASVAEVDLVDPSIVCTTIRYADLNVGLHHLVDNLARDTDLCIVIGEQADGWKLEIPDAFREQQRSAFFWG